MGAGELFGGKHLLSFLLLRAPMAQGGFYFFGQMAMRSARARGRAGFFFKLVLAPVARGSFLFRSNGFALRAGQSAGLVFSLSWFSRWWRGAGFLFWSSGLRSARARGRAVFSLSWFSRWWRGAGFLF
ncbi:MAG: hypothetical protein ACLT2X_06720, partial [Faecalibacterium prausnitzii]